MRMRKRLSIERGEWCSEEFFSEIFIYYLVILRITMDATTVKFEEAFSARIEKAMVKHHYATKAEFIREALREKLITLEKQEYMMQAFKLYGAGRKKHGEITDEDLHQTREKVARDIALELGVDL